MRITTLKTLFKNISEISTELSMAIKARRISVNLTQKQLSEKSGVSLSTLRSFEQTGKITLKHFLSILRGLNILDQLESLLAAPPLDPNELLSKKPTQGRTRKRVRIKENE